VPCWPRPVLETARFRARRWMRATSCLPAIEGSMTKNETELIISRTQVARAPPLAKCARCRPCMLSVALAALFSVGAWSQTQLATVSGTITDPTGAVVPGVSVTIVSPGTGLKRSALTDAAGEYRFAGLPTGSYSLRLEIPIAGSRRSRAQFGCRSDLKFVTRDWRHFTANYGQRECCRDR
jgi:hypothetical protein